MVVFGETQARLRPYVHVLSGWPTALVVSVALVLMTSESQILDVLIWKVNNKVCFVVNNKCVCCLLYTID